MNINDIILPLCPITGDIMEDPVTTPDGNTYERSAIETWLQSNNIEPQTLNFLVKSQLVPNRVLKDLYDNYIKLKNTAEDTIEEFILERTPLTLMINVKKNNNLFDILIKIHSSETEEEDKQDIIVCLDNSGSMATGVDKPGSEQTGLSIMDIVKHGVKTVINTCNVNQRIGITSFSYEGEIRCPLTQANESGKMKLLKSLDDIIPDGTTNLYDGIIKSWDILESRNKKNIKSTVILFTDGQPNSDPPRGYIPELKYLKEKNKGKYISDINIYTFGNNVDSNLSDQIARETEGKFGFMPDSSLIGDLLTHQIAATRNTRAKNNTLKIEIDNVNEFIIPNSIDYIKSSSNSIQINVGDILYGQDRNFVFSVKLNDDNIKIFASLDYNEDNTDTYLNLQTETITETNDFTELIYNKKRLELVDTITYIINYLDCNDLKSANNELTTFLTSFLPEYGHDNRLSLMKEDLIGQIKLAINPSYYSTWGHHYLLSIRRAYQLEQCNNFKDKGIQHFGSKLFNKILDEADVIFNKMPPPKVSRPIHSSIPQQPINMMTFNSRYNNSCFHGFSLVTMSDNTKKKVEDIIKGDIIKLGNGNTSIIECVIKTITNNNLIALNNSLHLTPYHPVKINHLWYFPINLPLAKESELECNAIYSFILNDRGNKSGILIGDIECATLGHGLTDENIIHPFFGTEKVIDNLKESNTYKDGLIILKENSLERDQNNLVYKINI